MMTSLESESSDRFRCRRKCPSQLIRTIYLVSLAIPMDLKKRCSNETFSQFQDNIHIEHTLSVIMFTKIPATWPKLSASIVSSQVSLL